VIIPVRCNLPGRGTDVKRKVQVNGSVHLPDRVTGKDGKSYPAQRADRDPRDE
jgi:hypothetical protein